MQPPRRNSGEGSLCAALTPLLLLVPAAARAATLLVLLNHPVSPAYREAFEGLRAEWKEGIETAPSDRPLPSGPYDVIIALGGRAARSAPQAGAPLVVALAPAYRAESRGTVTVRVAMTPSPERFVSLLAAAGVHRLLAVRGAPPEPEFVRRASEAGKRRGVAIEDAVLPAPEYLPGLLRGAGARADAVWLAPDPATVTEATFAVAREFSRERAVPFFAPAAGLVTGEIRGELTVSFRDCGREAARSARELLAGRPVEEVVYPREASEKELPPAR